jgi:hypothetical protein
MTDKASPTKNTRLVTGKPWKPCFMSTVPHIDIEEYGTGEIEPVNVVFVLR